MKKSLLCLFFAVTLMVSSCMGTVRETETRIGGDTESIGGQQTEVIPGNTVEKSDTFSLCTDGKTDFKLVYNMKLGVEQTGIFKRVGDAFESKFGAKPKILSDEKEETDFEIIINSKRRDASKNLIEQLSNGEYEIKAEKTGGGCRIILAGAGTAALHAVTDRFIEECIFEMGGVLPVDLDIKGKCNAKEVIIKSSIKGLRDPFILVDEDGTYYAFGTGWACFKNTSGSLSGEWEAISDFVKYPDDFLGDPWAPEVHKYKGMYYMFTTYFSKKINHRGCTILCSERPQGPYIEITDGVITPPEWSCIDGTLYVDDGGQPWMIFVYEWVSTDDGVGRMCAAKLSDDLTKFVSEPVELFRADKPVWAKNIVTDGPFIYKNAKGELLMLWSNWDIGGYCVGIARSVSGKVDGKWTQDSVPLYSKTMTKGFDGGHGMIFTDTDGQMYLSIHSPNQKMGSHSEAPIFVPIKETDGNLVWDLWKK